MKKKLVACAAAVALCASMCGIAGCAEEVSEVGNPPEAQESAEPSDETAEAVPDDVQEPAAGTEGADADAGQDEGDTAPEQTNAPGGVKADEGKYATASDITTGRIWQYTYAGEQNPVTSAICDELARIDTQHYDMADGMFPVVSSVRTTDDDDGVTKVYGVFEIDNYTLADGVLTMESGGVYPGVMTLATDDGSTYTVTKSEFAADGSDFMSSLVDICDGDSDLAGQIAAVSPTMDERLQFIRDYVGAYGLPATTLQDTDGTTVSL